VISTVNGMLVDTSCRTAALARLLQRLSPTVDPRLALGNTADTRSRVAGDRIVFVNLLPGFAATLMAHGFLLRWHQLAGEADWQDALAMLTAGHAIVVDADSFHLPHYWRNYQRSHGLHSVTLEDLDPHTSTVRLVDAVDESLFDGRVRLGDLRPALFSGQGQTWWEMRGGDNAGVFGFDGLRGELAGRMAELGHSALPGYVSGERLAEFIVEHLDEYAGSARQPVVGGAEAAKRGHHVSHAMWNYSHTLRWFGYFLAAVDERGGWPQAAASAAHIGASARLWLAARNTLMRLAVSDPSQFARFSTQIVRRLRSAVQHARSAVVALDELWSLV
jgi:hypothetical protein